MSNFIHTKYYEVIVNNFDFDYWKELAMQSPSQFEVERQLVIQQTITKSDELFSDALSLTQSKIESLVSGDCSLNNAYNMLSILGEVTQTS